MSATSPQDVSSGSASSAPESHPRGQARKEVTSDDVGTEAAAEGQDDETGEVQAQQRAEDRSTSEIARQEEEDVHPEAEEGEAEADVRHEDDDTQKEDGEADEDEDQQDTSASAPPLPDEVPPPLPNEVPPGEDDGWEPVWDANAQAYYFYNRLTGVSQWENPRVPDASSSSAAAAAPAEAEDDSSAQEPRAPVLGGYNPAIHGDYDPTAPYAQQYERQEEAGAAAMDANQAYEAVGAFNRFTGRWQAASQNPEYHNDENKSRRQMYAFFDVDAAANSHDGRSLRAERSAKKLTKAELKMFKEKRREKKEEKRRAWLRD
ncbi:WW domain-containing protein [Aspergillus saccharolyticus JOP 1030-1]|uniref:WW domain-containing protein n=1 Tax=Aspergillus saccharolyticus JOP 1030-1 TaxID=1450539 RepID=A0A318ZQD7_9EURO|nr:hypothetical protein BP01DRAFT_353145 [Aspergillus saccharolyticus JOP 1030-1]PYH48845.1 hypothetical protein BP01DRAFT_353145 [Aspergillus saccharolyticus JOP 1030-1]